MNQPVTTVRHVTVRITYDSSKRAEVRRILEEIGSTVDQINGEGDLEYPAVTDWDYRWE